MIATAIYYGQYTFGSYDLNLEARAHSTRVRARARMCVSLCVKINVYMHIAFNSI